MEDLTLIKKELEKDKEEAVFVLRELGLSGLVKEEEIEEALKETDQIYEHYLGLGAIMRCVIEKRADLLEKWLKGLSAWKNLTPHDDLDGLSPIEFEVLYPKGPEERRIITELIKNYQERVSSYNDQMGEGFDVTKDFQQFQEEFLSLVPNRQLFQNSDHLLTHREIIIEERKSKNVPKEKLEKIGLVIGQESIPEFLGEKVAQIQNNYYQFTKELDLMKDTSDKRNLNKVKEIYAYFREIEPFMKCMPEPWRFYNNKGNIEFLLDFKKEALNSLEISLSFNPEQEYAQTLINQIKRGEIF